MKVSESIRHVKKWVAPPVHQALDRLHRSEGRKAFDDAYRDAAERGCVRINVGSGRKPVSGWINTDVVRQGKIYLDATVLWPVPAGSVDLVYADNVIEHITLADTGPFFRHAFEAMKSGAIIRLATPDVEAVARQYLENGDLARSGMERNAEYGQPMRYPVELIRQVYVGAKHYLGFCHDYASLSAEMEAAGFVVRRVQTGESSHPDLVRLEVRTHPAEAATQLVVEGIKP